MTVEAYHALGEAGLIPEDTELLHGIVYRKMSKSPLHSFLLESLVELLRAVLPPGYILRAEQPMTLEDSEPEPDVAVVRGERARFRHTHPATAELVVEICISSHDYDRDKLRAYAAAGIREVWLVLAPERQVEVYREPESGAYSVTARVVELETLTSAALPTVQVSLAELFRA